MRKKQEDPKSEAPQPQFEDVLKRMLSSPPKQHKDEKVGKKPAQPKPAK